MNRTYQWEQSNNGIDWAIADGDAGVEFYIAPAITQKTLFRRMVLSESGCGFAYSDTLTVSVYDLLTGGTIASAGIEGVCVNTSPATLTASSPTGGAGEYRFQWQQCEDGVTWSDIVDATDETYNPPALIVETWYRRKVISKICEALSDTVKIEIYPSLSSGTMESLDQIICYNTSPGTLSVSIPVGGSGTYSYQWQHSGNSGALWTDIAGANGATYTPPALQSNSWYRRIVSGGCLAISDTVKIEILEASILRFPDVRLSSCPNNSAPIDLSKYIDIDANDPRIGGITWDKRGAAPAISRDGIIAANAFTGGGYHYTYTYTITTTGGCASDIPQKVYMRIIKGDFKMKTDTVAVCYETAETLHLNQIFGLETGGTFNYPFAIAQYLVPNSAGSLILDGKRAYEHDGLLETISYHGTTAKYIEFEYITGNDSCLKGKSYKIIVVLTPTL